MRVGVRLGLGAWGRTLLAGLLPPSRSPRCLWRGPRRPWLLQPRSSPRLRLRGPPPLQALLRVSRLLRLRLSLPKLRPRCGAAAALLLALLLGLLLVLRVLVLVAPVLRLLALLRLLRLPRVPLLRAAGCASPPGCGRSSAVCPVTACCLACLDPKGQTGRNRARAPKGDTERCWGLGHLGHPTTQHHSSPL